MSRPRISALDLADVLIYLVVLGTFTQLFPAVISESFLASLLTAIILKLVLEVVVWAKTGIVGRIKAAETGRVRVLAGASLFVVAAGSKALILWLIDMVMGDAIYLGGFFAVTLLVVTLMAARAGLRALIR
ncbi:hypothetical protein G7066_14085 [Leucobacter coleopterorum]|uniref:Uncharacterized protein n=1 Tax=Leucobacter coleopterorum TaxID=2714933 RepID=A0ABX6JYM8_9MICO|nr:hypothetical protein [Leucobacter coleopterorum]QIM19423.1 hypothetical protein G7066_14085 [Leucobacter coleopterorum]